MTWLLEHPVYFIPLGLFVVLAVLDIVGRIEERRWWKRFERERDEARRRAIFNRGGL